MEATHLTRRERRRLSIVVLWMLLVSIGVLSVVACLGPKPWEFFAGLASLAVVVPLLALALGWPILLLLGCKALIGLGGRWRRSAPRVPE